MLGQSGLNCGKFVVMYALEYRYLYLVMFSSLVY